MKTVKYLLELRQEMGFKLFLIAVGISLTVVLISSFLILTSERQQLIDLAKNTTTHLSDVIEASLEYALQNNDWELAGQTIRNVAETRSAERVWVLDAQGTVRLSTVPGEEGRSLDYSDPYCQFCHTSSERPGSLTRIVTLRGQNALLNVNMIRSESGCPDCSDQAENLLGLLLIEKPLTELNRELWAAFWRIVTIGLFTFVLLMGLLLFANRRMVLKPVFEINQGVAAIISGNLEKPIHVGRRDELGKLAEAFNDMRQKLKASYDEMEQRNHELALINDFALAAGQMLDPEQIMDLALDTVVDRLGMQAGFIRLYDEESDRFTLRVARGVSEEICDKIEKRRIESGPDLSQNVIQSGQALFIPDMSKETIFDEIWEELEYRSYVIIPLKSRGAAIGTLALITYSGRPLEVQNLEILKLVGHEIGIAIDNALLLNEAQEREREARALYNLVTQISASLELPQVLQAVAQGVRQITSTDLGLVGFMDESREEIVLQAIDGARSGALNDLRIPAGDRWIGCLMESGTGMHVEELTCDPALDKFRNALAAEGAVSLLVKPLRRSEKLLGLLVVATHRHHHFAKKEIQRMDRLAQQVVVAVENAELYQKVAYMATLEERERLAREMHDRLAQSLGYLNLKAAIIGDLLNENRILPAKDSLKELKEVSQTTYTDVREAIFNLRTTLVTGLRFLPTLETYIQEYRIHYGLAVHLETNGVDLSHFPADVDIQLLRIIQEALTNVRKHAHASQVWIRFKQADGWAKIVVEDDGRGFDPISLYGQGTRSFGLQIMRERAESVRGTLKLESRPGKGTRVVVRIPVTDYGRRG